jgi:hypothetical protein
MHLFKKGVFSIFVFLVETNKQSLGEGKQLYLHFIVLLHRSVTMDKWKDIELEKMKVLKYLNGSC